VSSGKGHKNSGNLQKIQRKCRVFLIIWRFPFPDVLSMPTTGLQHCTSKPPKITVSTNVVLPAEHGRKILTTSYAAQVTNVQWHA
jgi:hypothetical protein